jgi:hypothetical protein
LAEVQTDRRPIRDFLYALDSTDPQWSYAMQIQLKTSTINLLNWIETYRQHVRTQEAKKGSSSSTHSSAFSTSQSSQPSFRGQRPIPRCLCGTSHWYSECYYLNKDIQPTNWKPDETTKQQVDDKLKDSKIQTQVSKAMERYKQLQQQKKDKASNPQTSNSQANTQKPTELASFSAYASAFSTSEADTDLLQCWLLDSAANTHVCNAAMASRYTPTRTAPREDKLTAGSQILQIESYGTIQINVRIQEEGKTGIITLTDVAFVPHFKTNLVSLTKVKAKGVHWDTEKMHLHTKGKTLCLVDEINGIAVLEHPRQDLTSISSSYASFSTNIAEKPIRSATESKWHHTMAHVNSEAIQHLEAATEGVKVTKEDPAPKTHECQPCALAKAHQIISRSPEKEEDSDTPFYRISYDMIQLDEAYNSCNWITHIACTASGFNFVIPHRRKSDSPRIITNILSIIKTRYNGKVVFFRSDGEKSLSKEFLSDLVNQGISFEPSAPYTQSQNGHAERQGGILTIKARAMRLHASLPHTLWPEIYQTAGYIMNRTPTYKLSWKTPFEVVTGGLPDLSHLRVLGCKVYPLYKHIPRLQKLVERAHIGHLVGYDSRNIYRVWIPSQQKVIRTRDVIFNEDQFYNPDEPDLAQLIEEPMISVISIPPLLTNEDTSSILDLDLEDDLPDTTSDSSLAEKSEFNACNTTACNAQLPSPPPTECGTSISLEESSIQMQERAGNTQNTAARAEEISASLNNGNILSEGSKRLRKPSRRDAYSTAIQQAADGEISGFHTAFNQSYAFASTLQSTRPHRDQMPPPPRYYKQVHDHEHSQGFREAMRKEISTLQSKNTWKEVTIEEAQQDYKHPLPLTWVYTYKFDSEGYLSKYKARLCARGDLQYTEQETYAATLAARTFRTLMALVAAFDLETRQLDAVNAFANSKINETLYCYIPDGYPEYSRKSGQTLLLLQRALYGLKQSPLLWHQDLSATLIELGLYEVPGVNCLFTNDHMIIFFFVDDIAILYSKEYEGEVDQLQAKLCEIYEMRHLGELNWFLGIRITRNRDSRKLWLCQDSYIDKLAAKFKISDTGLSKTPLPVEELRIHTDKASSQDIYSYQQHVGSLSFIAAMTRPDTASASSKLSEHLRNPSSRHQQLAKRALEYLVCTKFLAIEFTAYTKDPTRNILTATSLTDIFQASSDASFANDPDTRRSSQGYVFQLFRGPIDWKASKQRTVTTSSTEAELLALSHAAKETQWWTRFFEAIQFDPGHETAIQCDNKQTLRLLTENTPKLSTKLRHVDIYNHWLRQEIQHQRLKVTWTPSAKIVADGLTKALPFQRHEIFVQQLNLVDIRDRVKM